MSAPGRHGFDADTSAEPPEFKRIPADFICRISNRERNKERDMYQIVRREDYSDVNFMLEVEHPLMARAARPGQFVIVRLTESGERIPLTIADFDRRQGTVTLVIQAVGKTTREMKETCHAGHSLASLVGPMGMPSHIGEARKVVCVGGGLGVAPVFPQLRAHKENGTYTIGVVGFRSRELMFWVERFDRYCDELIICTDDGSAGIHGRVTDGLIQAMRTHRDIDEVIAIGPPIMMKACAETTQPRGIRTTVSLNPIMVDGTGMCGGCRVTVGNQMKFACVDGPDFDGHQVDFNELMNRLRRYREDEQRALERWERHREHCNLMQGTAHVGGEA